jgi:phosphate transport system protein
MIKPRQRFQNKIGLLLENTFTMAGMAQQMIIDSVDALIKKDAEKAKIIIESDDQIDEYFRNIELMATQLLATQQPMAKDLRTIAGILKIITDIERLGDYSVDIAKGAQYLASPLSPAASKILKEMRKTTLEMLDNCLESLKSGKVDTLEKIAKKDSLVDKNFGLICNHVVTRLVEYKTENHGQHEITVLLAGRHLERMADHITNICEKIHYIVTGDVIELH